MNTVFKVAGSVATLLAIVGFFTVADDLRHTGELVGVSSLLLGGLALMAAAWLPQLRRHLTIQWLAVGLAIGALAGEITDAMFLSSCGGLMLGILVSYLRRERSIQSSVKIAD